MSLKVALCVPVYNGGERWAESLHAYHDLESLFARRLVVDSGSSDDSLSLAREQGFETLVISAQDFDHGATRQWMVEQVHDDVDVVLFATQDAVLEDPVGITALLETFIDESVGAAYARQLPHRDAGPLGAHARLFNYPDNSRVTSMSDTPKLGIKAAFISNSFAAYRIAALDEVGGFPAGIILGEDTYAAAKMLMAGWKVAYSAEAKVYHSHDYTTRQEFQRYFDIGVLHAREHWMLDTFGNPEGEGGRFVRSELAYLLSNAPLLLPLALVRTLSKYAGYRLGRLEKWLPPSVCKRLSMHRQYWV